MIHSVEFPHPLLLLIGICLGIGSAWLLMRRRRLLGTWPAILVAGGILCAGIAASSARVVAPSREAVRVLVDRSASTRGAAFREESALRQRVEDLLGGRPYEIADFDGRTFNGPALLFSDGQFSSVSGSGAIFPVIDETLLKAKDARVVDIVQERGAAIAIVENTGDARELSVGGQRFSIAPGRHRLRIGSDAEPVSAMFAPGDAWPENDALRSLPAAPNSVQRWSCGVTVPTANFVEIAPEDIPSHVNAFASTSILLLDAGVAASLSAGQQQAIASWVRNLGGSLVLVGQDAGWAKLRQSAIDEISPLSPDPPISAREWVIAIDVSGSMAQVDGGEEKWRTAIAAGAQLARSLPRRDLARVGLFSADMRWIASGAAAEVSFDQPAQFVARGPTNLEAALESALALPAATEREVVLLTDAEVELPELDRTVARFRAGGVRVSCLVLSEGRGRELLQRLCAETGGTVLAAPDARQWTRRAEELAGRLAPARWHEGAAEVFAVDPLPKAVQTVRGWNEGFIREGAAPFAEAGGRPMAAQWRLGLGRVAAVAFPLPEEWAATLAGKLEQLPTAAGFEVRWLEDSVQVSGPASVDLRMSIATALGTTELPLAAVAPRRYEAELPDLSAGGHVVIRDGSQIVARRSFEPRYTREFARIGVDAQRLTALARETGGRVIEVGERGPVAELASRRLISLATVFGVAGALLLAGGVMVLRRRL